MRLPPEIMHRMKIQIPQKAHIQETHNADPLKWYYIWGARSFYLHRLKLCLEMMASQKVGTLLDIGFASGIFLPELSKRSQALHGIDLHADLTLVNNMMQQEGLQATLVNASVTDIPYPADFFDCIVCMSVLEHVKDLPSAIDEIFRVLKPNGQAILGFPVENPLSRLIFKIAYIWHPQIELDDEHVSTHYEILQATAKRFEMIQHRQVPPLVPRDFSLYYLCDCRKRSSGPYSV